MKADIAFEDEAWIGCGNHSGRMWGLVGQPLEIRACDEKCGDHVLSMVTAEGELMFDVKTEKLVSSVCIDFLKKMIGNRTRPLIVIADKASYYMSHEVKKFAEDHALGFTHKSFSLTEGGHNL
ncbi:MAG TPA: transposase, partial [Sphingobacterium sp.]|nr:transposase [Sphingobacterium sp.]